MERHVGDYARYGIYYAPPKDSALAAFGAAWFGWDADVATKVDRLDVAGLPTPAETLTARAARYGFHATLKAPFRLREGVSPTALVAAVADFAEDTPPVSTTPLALLDDLGFPALRPSGPAEALDALAADIVQSLDGLRAPLTEAELNRRRSSALTPQEDAHLERWGYPYVLDAFRFHMTLSRQAEKAETAAVVAALAPHVAPLIGEPFEVREICVFGEPQASESDDPYARHFRLLRRFRLTG